MKKNRSILKIRPIYLVVIFIILGTIILYGIIRNAKDSKIDMDDFMNEKMMKDVEELGWDNEVVRQIAVDNVPIPKGYYYAEGDTSTGLLAINENDQYQLWIPYQENITVDVSDYSKKLKTGTEEEIESIKKYGGFYVSLNQSIAMEDLKDMNSSLYNECVEQLDGWNSYNYDDTTKQHVLSGTDVAQILQYASNNNLDIKALKIGIQANNIELDAFAADNTGDEYVGKYIDVKDNVLYNKWNSQVPIPAGYRYEEENGIIMIKDKDEKNKYIWVPLNANSKEDLIEQKKRIKKFYEEYTEFAEDSTVYDYIVKSTEEYEEGFVQSIIKYGGFYINIDELKQSKDEYYTGKQCSDYKRINEAMKKIEENSLTTVSHLMYGVEYDATLLWIIETANINNVYNVMLKDSTNYGNYSNSTNIIKNNFNGIYNLGGNLEEVTQERIKENENIYYILRGGSKNRVGNKYTIATRTKASKLDSEYVGFRNCLYIGEEVEKTNDVEESIIIENKENTQDKDNTQDNEIKENDSQNTDNVNKDKSDDLTEVDKGKVTGGTLKLIQSTKSNNEIKWKNENILVTASYYPNEIVDDREVETYFKINGSEKKAPFITANTKKDKYTATTTIGETGTYNVSARVNDKVNGKINKCSSSVVSDSSINVYHDITPPDIFADVTISNCSGKKSRKEKYAIFLKKKVNGNVSADIQVKITATDTDSGVDSVSVSNGFTEAEGEYTPGYGDEMYIGRTNLSTLVAYDNYEYCTSLSACSVFGVKASGYDRIKAIYTVYYYGTDNSGNVNSSSKDGPYRLEVITNFIMGSIRAYLYDQKDSLKASNSAYFGD